MISRVFFLFFISFCLFFPRKEQIAEQREYKKKKAQKKVQRMKELEQEREDQKSKWQQFNNKAYSKNKKGQVFTSKRFWYFWRGRGADVANIQNWTFAIGSSLNIWAIAR